MPNQDPVEPPDATELAELGPFFQVRRATGAGSWRLLRDLLDGSVLDARVSHVHSALAGPAGAEVEERVAASTMSLGLFARLLSPVLGSAALGIALPRPGLDDTWWQPVERGPWPLALTGPAMEPDPGEVVGETVTPLVEVLSARYSLSQQVLWGNVASAVFGAVSMVGYARPDLARAAVDLGDTLLTGPLAGTGRHRNGRFVRASCCLYYRVPGGGYCGDCVLTHQ